MSNILERINKFNLLRITYVLGLSIFFSVAIVLFRILYTESITFGFLLWNLFLAGLPLLVSMALLIFDRLRHHTFLFWGMVSLWLIFFPNAPYIITDLIHLKPRLGVPLWFDALLLFSFVWNGLLLGYFSLYFMHNMIRERTSNLLGWGFTIVVLGLTGFGVYLGRFLRWNSWDILTNPLGLFVDIADRFVNPFIHPRTWAMTILLSTFLFLGYLVFRQMTRLELNE